MNVGISEKASLPSKYIEIYGSKMHYIEIGKGNPILFLHGIPTSSYIWRNIIPYLTSLGRCIAPDLIGFGWSDKPDIKYSVIDHIKYIEKFIETLNLNNIILVMHGWGSVIGFNYSMHHENNCIGLVFYEAFLKTLDKNEISLPLKEQLMTLQDEETEFDVTLRGASFVDKIIPQSVMRQMSDEEMNYYREPFMKEGTAKPIIQYLKELPTGNETEIDKLITEYILKLTKSKLPKLMLYSVPGFITPISIIMWAKENLPNLETVDIGEELHLAQESNPKLIGETISAWLQGIEQTKV